MSARAGRSLFWTIAALFVPAALLGVAAQSLVAITILRPLETRDLHARAELAVTRFAGDAAAAVAPPDSAALQTLLAHVRDEVGLRVPMLFRGADGRVVGDRPEFAVRLAAELDGRATPRRRPGRPADETPRWNVAARRAVEHGDRPLGEVLVLAPARPRTGRVDGNALLLSLPIALLATLGAALVLVRLLVGRLRALERFAVQVAADDLGARVEDARDDEIGRLAGEFNRMAERLAGARERLAEEERRRRQLFADITHELATPLTLIRGYTETLLDPAITASADERAHYLNDILSESQRLDRLIRDLFDLSRLEAGVSPLERERLDWAALARHVAARLEPRFTAAGLRLTGPAESIAAWVDADGHRLVQVLENLLVNALRYVPPGGRIAVSVARVEDDAGAPRWRLAVTDDGAGVPEVEVPLLFERFYRSSGPRAGGDDHEGSGLGLAIVREIVQRHGGRVRALPARPHGLIVEVELPAIT